MNWGWNTTSWLWYMSPDNGSQLIFSASIYLESIYVRYLSKYVKIHYCALQLYWHHLTMKVQTIASNWSLNDKMPHSGSGNLSRFYRLALGSHNRRGQSLQVWTHFITLQGLTLKSQYSEVYIERNQLTDEYYCTSSIVQDSGALKNCH